MKNSETGSTLIELLLVIIIISIMTGAAVQSTKPRDLYSLNRDIEMIAADLRWARNKAVLDNKTYVFRIFTSNPGQNSLRIPYCIYVEEAGQKIIKRRGSYSAEFTLYRTLDNIPVIEDYYEWIRFRSTASARGGSIALGDNSGRIYRTVVNQLGRVRIEK